MPSPILYTAVFFGVLVGTLIYHVYTARNERPYYDTQHRNEPSQRESHNNQRRKRRTSSLTRDNCTICLEKMGSGEDTIEFSCQHKFHSACISKWFKNQKICPNCRKEL